ncbi:UDP-N-acetylglucosamine 2-epimerase (non-hydrolyzing) [candidate division KSB3 bacterium]|uniref:UDP-N-acetylglucosamine 2-epimerase (Non-hydrolyzing) n=1 Tax=candidate division KSB3 bacterium TaxID=2044937 RepID=A0A2G6KE67_9BACT|nr:MAG: UDP-N-acetylglucosamine 2-epimerase (non-hydrolyzing) [candidate division KSB3 bacterium]
MKIVNVAGARPNFMKIAPLMKEMNQHPDIQPILVHTGQHYDEKMSKLFFEDLQIPKPDIDLEVGSASHSVQTAKIMIAFEQVLLQEQPDLVLVVGDVNSTIGCALPAVKQHIPVAHVEAGLRSFDRDMPEEINRILTDSISSYLFITEPSGKENLLREGISEDNIYFVGNVMIDTLMANKAKAEQSQVLQTLDLVPQNYAVLTLHRPSNVDNRETFLRILNALENIQSSLPIVFPIHPRTRNRLDEFSFMDRIRKMDNFRLVEPLGYLDFLKLVAESKLALTDSGGIQEETTILKIPCITLRENTERPITVQQGTNVIVGTDTERIIQESHNVLNGKRIASQMPDLWDGKAAGRIVKILLEA